MTGLTTARMCAAPTPGADPAAPLRAGVSTFTIEGRAAPGLFVVGWLATIAGLALVLIGALSASGFFLYFLGPLVLAVGLIAGAGNQAIERRARGFPYAGPSPYLVLAATVAAIYVVAAVVGLGLRLVLGDADVPSYVVNLIGVGLQALVFVGIIRLTVVGTGALSWAEMGWRRFDGRALRDVLFGARGGTSRHRADLDPCLPARQHLPGRAGVAAATHRHRDRARRAADRRRGDRADRRGGRLPRVCGHGLAAHGRRHRRDRPSGARLRAGPCDQRHGRLARRGRRSDRRRLRVAPPGRARARLAASSGPARSGRRSGCTWPSTGSCCSSPRSRRATAPA